MLLSYHAGEMVFNCSFDLAPGRRANSLTSVKRCKIAVRAEARKIGAAMNISVEELVQIVCSSNSSEEQRGAAAGAFLSQISKGPDDVVNEAMRTLARNFGYEDPSRAAFLALVCGAMVENGADPSAIAQPLTARLQSLLEPAVAFVEECRSEMPAVQDDDDLDPYEQFEEVKNRLSPERTGEISAWEALNVFWRPAIAVYSVSTPARESAKALRPLAQQIADYHEGGHWLQLILSVLCNEPIAVIEPTTRLGFVGRFSGVVDNFQLNILLMDMFPHSETGLRRIPPAAGETVRGIGPQVTDELVTGVWNLYTWQAVRQDLTLPDRRDTSITSHWIWNEGIPSDIPLFQGMRTVLLGPASYERIMKVQRMFNHLPAQIAMERELSRSDITSLLEQMARQVAVEPAH